MLIVLHILPLCLQAIQQLNHEQLLERDTGNESGTSLASGMGPGPAGHSSGIGGSAITGTVTPTTTAGSLTAGQHSYSTTSSSLTAGGAYVMRSEGSFLAAASGALEFGSTIGGSWTSSMAGSGGTGQSGPQGMLRSFTTKQVRMHSVLCGWGVEACGVGLYCWWPRALPMFINREWEAAWLEFSLECWCAGEKNWMKGCSADR
jgi:hypothetical protein